MSFAVEVADLPMIWILEDLDFEQRGQMWKEQGVDGGLVMERAETSSTVAYSSPLPVADIFPPSLVDQVLGRMGVVEGFLQVAEDRVVGVGSMAIP